MPRISDIRIRRDTAANWTTADPALAVGELGIETDTRRMKVGTGSAVWSSLQYMGFDGLKPEIADGLAVIAGRDYSYTIGTAPNRVICTMRAVQSRTVGAFATDAEKITELDPANWTLIGQSNQLFVASTVLPEGYEALSGQGSAVLRKTAIGVSSNTVLDRSGWTAAIYNQVNPMGLEDSYHIRELRYITFGTVRVYLRANAAGRTNTLATPADRASEYANWTYAGQEGDLTVWPANLAVPAGVVLTWQGIRRRRLTTAIAGASSVVGIAGDLANWVETGRETPLVLATMIANGEIRQSAANLGPTFTVDQYRYATIAQVTAGIVATLPAPTDATAVRTFSIFNSGTAMTIENKAVATNTLVSWTWIGGGWR